MKLKLKLVHLIGILIFSVFFVSCAASSFPISFVCDEQDIEIYVNDEYVGRGLVSYTVPAGTEEVKVSCRENGIEIYNRTFYCKGNKNQLFELNIPKDYRYSSGQPIKPRTK